MTGIDRARLRKNMPAVFLVIACAAVFCVAEAEAKNWSRYFGDEKIVQGIGSGDAKEALVSTICR